MGAEKAPPEPKVCVNTAQLIGGLSKCIHQKWFTRAALFPRLVTKEAEHLAVCSHSGGAAAGDNFAALLPQRIPPRYYFKSTAPQVLASKANKFNQQKQASSSQSWRSCTNAESPAKQRLKMAPAHRQPRRPLCPPVLAAPWARRTACFEKLLGDLTEYCLACS